MTTITTPDLYLYLNSRIVEQAAGSIAFARWEDPNDFGSSQPTPVAALKSAGEISFVNTVPNGETLPIGTYRLEVDSGNIGKVDNDFDGFSVLITVGDTVLSKKLQAGKSGADFHGVEVFEFDLENAVTGTWLLTFDWTNSYSNPQRGEYRQLAVHGFVLRRLKTEVYRVSIAPSGTTPVTTLLSTGTYSADTPGGWVAVINSWGQVRRWVHESQIYPSNDTLTSKLPVSNLLTASTGDKREDHITDTEFVLVDPVDPDPVAGC